MDAEYTEATFGDAWASIYDDEIMGWGDPSRIVAFLAERADGERALDLGVGTGRIAVPLARAGVPVVGVDSSAEMLRQAKEKAGDTPVTLVQQDMARLDLAGQFRLVYCVGNSFFCLPSQRAQQECLARVAERLSPDGRFVLELLMVDQRRFRVGQDVLANKVRTGRVLLTAATHDPLEQRIESTTIEVAEGGVRLFPYFVRYCWPSELLLMAQMAGFELVGRYANYGMAPFTGVPGAYVAEFRLAPRV